jgi:hypothetical protein
MTTTETAQPPQKTKVEKAQSYLALASTSIGIIGAVGTVFVWLTASFFTGDLQINPDKPVPSMMVKVVDSKGQQAVYYNKCVALMPGDYHLEFGIPDKQPTVHADAHVNLWKKTEIAYAVPATLVEAPPDPNADGSAKRKWWQFWKRRSDQ